MKNLSESACQEEKEEETLKSPRCGLLCDQRGPIDCDTSFITPDALEQRYHDTAAAHAAVHATATALQQLLPECHGPPASTRFLYVGVQSSVEHTRRKTSPSAEEQRSKRRVSRVTTVRCPQKLCVAQ